MRALIALVILATAALLAIALDPSTDWHTDRGSVQGEP